MVKDYHKEEAFEVLEFLRSELVKDFTQSLGLEITQEQILECVKNQILSGRYNDAALLIIKEKFHQQFDIKELMLKLVEDNKIETVKLLIQHQDESLKKDLIFAMSNVDQCKKADQYIKEYRFDPEEFPQVKEFLAKRRMHNFLGDLYKQQHKQDFMTLDRVEDLLSGHKQMLAYLVEELLQRDKVMEAKGIYLRNRLQK